MKYIAKTDIGKKYLNNEDYYILPVPNKKYRIKKIDKKNNGFLFILCDGMGGGKAGEVASELASNWIFQKYYGLTKIVNPKLELGNIIIEINKKIFQLSKDHEEYSDMGTTLITLLFHFNKVFINSVGDSRIYLYRKNRLIQITEDQSEVWDLYKNGIISKDAIRTHPRNHIINRAIGTEDNFVLKHINQYEMDLQKKDIYLMCSDGLSDMVSDVQIAEILTLKSSLKKKASELVNLANKNGGKDNITVILVQV